MTELIYSTRSRKLPSWATGIIGVGTTIAIWWILAITAFANVGIGSDGAIPTPLEVVQQLFEDGWGFYFRNGSVTLAEAAIGFAWGNGLALGLQR